MTRIPRIAWRIYFTGAAVAALTFTFTNTFFKNETMWDDAFAGAFVAILVVGFMYQRELNKKEIEKHACKGQNSCKGNGGGSKKEWGKNSCKGQGACATDGTKK